MNKNIFVTGFPGFGKSTLVREIVSELDREVCWILTPEIRKDGER